MDNTVIINMQQAFTECSRCYEVVRTHRGFWQMPSEMIEQIQVFEQEVKSTSQRLSEALETGHMTPEVAQEACLYAQYHIEMVMDVLGGLNALSGSRAN
ncbi:hypothetical protein [Deinococcus roseus]|uniref:Uncharacterized protein n=1 Tax=Deinococcus roseus TaxID=392414 RepID=A0ABQ2D237_9DEIO|nr:hypothetical protein [Deinococcus roseus]GGJ39190.1 hypothetical protein GCM10008938_26510 [Deinococcus roseus]